MIKLFHSIPVSFPKTKRSHGKLKIRYDYIHYLIFRVITVKDILG